MSECFRCGVSSEKARLYDVLSNRQIIKLCETCNHIEKLPIIKRPSEEQILDSKNPRSKSVRDRLDAMRGVKKPYREVTLKNLIDKDYQAKKIEPPSDLIPNFHWAIQRIRRNRKITRQEFAKGIGESERTVQMIEQGYLPDSGYRVVNKIEGYLGISLRKNQEGAFQIQKQKNFVLDDSLTEKTPLIEPKSPKEIKFNREEVKKWTIKDLLGMKKKEEKKIEEENDYPQDDEKFLDEKEEFNEEDL